MEESRITWASVSSKTTLEAVFNAVSGEGDVAGSVPDVGRDLHQQEYKH